MTEGPSNQAGDEPVAPAPPTPATPPPPTPWSMPSELSGYVSPPAEPTRVHAAAPAPELATIGAPAPPPPPPSVSNDMQSPDDGGSAPVPKKEKGRPFYRELPMLIGIALVLALVLKALVVQAYFIPSASMEKTLHGCPGCRGDRVLVNKVGYKLHSIHRGDIVVFNGKHTTFPQETFITPASNPFQSAARTVQRFLGLGAPGERDYIKRVIGVGGDTVQCCTDGHVVVNGRVLNETYLFEDDHQAFCLASGSQFATTLPSRGTECQVPGAKPFVVPKGSLFVMGDHRSASSDSRYNGVIPESAVIGRAFVLIWPFSRFTMFGTPPDFS